MTGPEMRTVSASTPPGHGDGRAETVVVDVSVAVVLPVVLGVALRVCVPVMLGDGVPVGVAVRERVWGAVTEAVGEGVDEGVGEERSRAATRRRAPREPSATLCTSSLRSRVLHRSTGRRPLKSALVTLAP